MGLMRGYKSRAKTRNKKQETKNKMIKTKREITSSEGVTAQWVKLDKSTCEKLLAVVPSYQRNKKKSTLSMIVKDLEKGYFRQNGSPIVISDQGYLIDGQHRITAFLKSGVFPEVLMVTGVSEKYGYATIDSGSSRSYADVFKSKGVSNYCRKATISVILLGLLKKTYCNGPANSRQSVYDCYLENKESIDYWSNKYPALDSNIAATIRAASACYAEKIIPREKIHAFFEAVESGIGARTCIAFRKAIIVNSNKIRGKMHQKEMVSLCIHAIDLFDQGIEQSRMVMPKKFPYLEEV